ncbi:MAG: aminopeptidase N [Planctomycetota bacterium]
MPTAPKAIHLKDYKPYSHRIDSVELDIDIHEDVTRVKAHLVVTAKGSKTIPMTLFGEHLKLVSLKVNGRELSKSEYTLDDHSLTLKKTTGHFDLETVVEIKPQLNKALSGLYKSGPMYCTQCEAEGFRRITFYPDRPDVMSVFTVTLHADKTKYPVLLSNGNPVGSGMESKGRHWAKWHDPFPKPSYLFACVAGKLEKVESSFTTMSGRKIPLRLYVEKGNETKVEYAMKALKLSMKWDEEAFGREYDLDIFMIVAVGDFNMGAMENKGLNIFNSRLLVADTESATDGDFEGILGVVAHEYFHNWTGNRITCRDWFQLTLKEGLTVYRDQEFSSDMGSRTVKRIGDARMLRDVQFIEDGGPMTHPIRPSSYIEINNFYTATVYSKGAEVIRMIERLIGKKAFRKGMDLYFERHDGQAVTCEDFVQAMQDASGYNLSDFKRWYNQAGTPTLKTTGTYNPKSKTYTLAASQSCRPTPETKSKKPFTIPLTLGLISRNGRELPLRLQGEKKASGTCRTLAVTKAKQVFTFMDVKEEPVPSLLRGFSAPVRLEHNYTDEQLGFLLACDSDLFTRFDASQKLGLNQLLRITEDLKAGRLPFVDQRLIEQGYKAVLNDSSLDMAVRAEILTLPSPTALLEEMRDYDVTLALRARDIFFDAVARGLEKELMATYNKLAKAERSRIDGPAFAARRLKNTCLAYLALRSESPETALALGHFEKAGNMTDSVSALSILAQAATPERSKALKAFEKRWKKDSLVMNKWFAVQSSSRDGATLATVKSLARHPAYHADNPNMVRSLEFTFASNLRHFHSADGTGYTHVADEILRLDGFNPGVAGRLATFFKKYPRLDGRMASLAETQLRRIVGSKKLSKDVFEVVSRTLGARKPAAKTAKA